MSAPEHRHSHEDIGAYVLGALTDEERHAFEQHLAACADCRDEVDRLRPAVDALPRSVEQLQPPPSLKATLMDVVEREAKERTAAQAPARTPPRQRRFPRPRLPSITGMRPAFTAGVLAIGLAAGFGAAQLADNAPESRTVVAIVDQSRLPQASARLLVIAGGEDGAILRVSDMPSPGRDRVYQAWVERDGTVVPQPTFQVGADGSGAVAVPADISGARAVLVTREPRGGSRTPSERPVIAVPLT